MSARRDRKLNSEAKARADRKAEMLDEWYVTPSAIEGLDAERIAKAWRDIYLYGQADTPITEAEADAYRMEVLAHGSTRL